MNHILSVSYSATKHTTIVLTKRLERQIGDNQEILRITLRSL